MSAGKEKEKLEEDVRMAAAPELSSRGPPRAEKHEAGLVTQPRLVRGEGGSVAPGVRRVLGTARPHPGAGRTFPLPPSPRAWPTARPDLSAVGEVPAPPPAPPRPGPETPAPAAPPAGRSTRAPRPRE